MPIFAKIDGLIDLPDKSAATNKMMVVADLDDNETLGLDVIPSGLALEGVKVTLTAAEMRDSFATPITILPALGTNTLALYLKILVIWNTPGAFSGSNGNIRIVNFNDRSLGCAYIGLTTGNTDFCYADMAYDSGSGAFKSDFVNNDLKLRSEVALTGGSGTFDIYITYHPLTLT